MQYKRLFKYDPQCWMPSVEGHVICGHTDFVTSFLYFDTKSWTLIAYCALMLSIVNLTLAEMITAQEEKLTELENLCEAASEELEKTAELMDKVSRLYDELISYADLYDSANFEAKKMIVNQLIRRVDVYRGYQINISFNFDLTPYIEGE